MEIPLSPELLTYRKKITEAMESRIALDLAQKAADDAVAATKRTMELADNSEEKIGIALSAAAGLLNYAAGGVAKSAFRKLTPMSVIQSLALCVHLVTALIKEGLPDILSELNEMEETPEGKKAMLIKLLEEITKQAKPKSRT